MQRIMKEKKELESNPPTSFLLYPMNDDVFEWHFTLMGTPDSDYDGGLYHGRIILPKNYPLSAPDLIFMTVSLSSHLAFRPIRSRNQNLPIDDKIPSRTLESCLDR